MSGIRARLAHNLELFEAEGYEKKKKDGLNLRVCSAVSTLF